jgi:predicted secreted Zn-dependent protease
MDPVLLGKLFDLGTAGLMFVVIFYSFKEFKSVLISLSDTWQKFIQGIDTASVDRHKTLGEDIDSLNTSIEKKVVDLDVKTRERFAQISKENTAMLQVLINLREDFIRAVSMMEERTRNRDKDKENKQ